MSTKTRSALRATLKQEDAALEERLPEASPPPATQPEAAVPAETVVTPVTPATAAADARPPVAPAPAEPTAPARPAVKARPEKSANGTTSRPALAASAMTSGSQPASWTDIGNSSGVVLAMSSVLRFSRTIAAEAIISETTSPAPWASARRRMGASVMPAIGARNARFGKACPPMLKPQADSVTQCPRNAQLEDMPQQ